MMDICRECSIDGINYIGIKNKCSKEGCNSYHCRECDPNQEWCSNCNTVVCIDCYNEEDEFYKLCNGDNTFNCHSYTCPNCRVICIVCENNFCDEHTKFYDYQNDNNNYRICYDCILRKYEGFGNNKNVKYLFKKFLVENCPLIPDLAQIVQDYVGNI